MFQRQGTTCSDGFGHFLLSSSRPPLSHLRIAMSAAAKGKGKKRAADEGASFQALAARLQRPDLEALLVELLEVVPDLRARVEAKLAPAQVRCDNLQSERS